MSNITKKIIDDLKNGDESAFEVIFYEYKNKIFYYCMKFTKNIDDANDCFQDIFLKMLENIIYYDDNLSKFSTWFYTIAHNYLINFVSAKRRHNEILHIDEEAVERASRSSNSDLYIILAEVERVLGKETYEIVMLKIGFNMTFDEIAVLKCMNISNVKRIYYKALKEARKFVRGK